MTVKEKSQPSPWTPERLEWATATYGRVLSGIMMVMGLHAWAMILGLVSGPFETFDAMPTPWKIMTMHFAVIDLVAAVGLWQRMHWGIVVWIYAALLQILLHTVFSGTFGTDALVIGFYVVTLAVYVSLFILQRRLAK